MCVSNLTPGGYMELADICFPIRVDDDSFPENSALQKWSRIILDGTVKAGRPINSCLNYRAQMEEAGFVNVVQVEYRWPQNPWPKDSKFKRLGMSIVSFHICPVFTHISPVVRSMSGKKV